jgi:arginine decarboxylase
MNMQIRSLLAEIPFTRKRDPEFRLTHILNKETRNTIRWCTPSIDLESAQVKNPYESDTSISYESLGFPSEPSGVFKKMYDCAARVYGADHTVFSVNGSSGSNFMVLRALSKQIPNLRVLAQRNVHKSIVSACEDYGINLQFLPFNIDQKFQLFLPNTEEEILEGIKKTKPQVLLLTNPTYEGNTLHLKKIIASIRETYPDLIIFIDEAWGAHLHFSDKLPSSAMESGADICVQSTHKQGGALQQGGMIHWKKERVNTDLIMDSYRSLLTTSPSYILIASLDAARELMEQKGAEKIDHILTIADKLAQEINKIPGLEVITTSKLKKRNKSVYSRDESKVLIDVTKSGYKGFEIANLLEERHGIIVEIYTMNTIMLLVPFRANIKDIFATVRALQRIVRKPNENPEQQDFTLPVPTDVTKVIDLSVATNLLWNQIEKIPLKHAEGRIAAEHITPYPPGVPLTIKGEAFTKAMIEYYLALKDYPNSHIVAQDKTLETVWVVK